MPAKNPRSARRGWVGSGSPLCSGPGSPFSPGPGSPFASGSGWVLPSGPGPTSTTGPGSPSGSRPAGRLGARTGSPAAARSRSPSPARPGAGSSAGTGGRAGASASIWSVAGAGPVAAEPTAPEGGGGDSGDGARARRSGSGSPRVGPTPQSGDRDGAARGPLGRCWPTGGARASGSDGRSHPGQVRCPGGDGPRLLIGCRADGRRTSPSWLVSGGGALSGPVGVRWWVRPGRLGRFRAVPFEAPWPGGGVGRSVHACSLVRPPGRASSPAYRGGGASATAVHDLGGSHTANSR